MLLLSLLLQTPGQRQRQQVNNNIIVYAKTRRGVQCGGYYNYNSNSIRRPFDWRSTVYQRSLGLARHSHADLLIYLGCNATAQDRQGI